LVATFGDLSKCLDLAPPVFGSCSPVDHPRGRCNRSSIALTHRLSNQARRRRRHQRRKCCERHMIRYLMFRFSCVALKENVIAKESPKLPSHAKFSSRVDVRFRCKETLHVTKMTVPPFTIPLTHYPPHETCPKRCNGIIGRCDHNRSTHRRVSADDVNYPILVRNRGIRDKTTKRGR
jgi:hypothetical protein